MFGSTIIAAYHKIFDGPTEYLHKRISSRVPTGNDPSELDPATEEAIQFSFYFESNFQDTSYSTTAGYFCHCVLVLRCAETTTAASQLEGHLQATPVEQFPENHDILE
jgi:hypothetical protein